jgi:hypothetical protein
LGENHTPKGSETRIDIREKEDDTTKIKNGHIEFFIEQDDEIRTV